MTVWVHGPTSWDSVVELSEFPQPGAFLRAKSKFERPGGSGLNVAYALARTGVEVGFITYLGDDVHGRDLRKFIETLKLKEVIIRDFDVPTLNALIFNDPSGERTIIALEITAMNKLDLAQVMINSGDIFVFTIWRAEYKPMLETLREIGALIFVGAKALEDEEVFADIAIGSIRDYLNVELTSAQKRFGKIVLTDGKNGAKSFTNSGIYEQQTLATEVVDTTGAGDAFLAGYVYATAQRLSEQDCLFLASAWAASAISSKSSLPPTWVEVKSLWGL